MGLVSLTDSPDNRGRTAGPRADRTGQGPKDLSALSAHPPLSPCPTLPRSPSAELTAADLLHGQKHVDQIAGPAAPALRAAWQLLLADQQQRRSHRDRLLIEIVEQHFLGLSPARAAEVIADAWEDHHRRQPAGTPPFPGSAADLLGEQLHLLAGLQPEPLKADTVARIVRARREKKPVPSRPNLRRHGAR